MRSSLYVSQPVIPESEQSLACSVLFNTIECSLHLGELLSLLKLQGCQSGRRSLMAAAELCSAVRIHIPMAICPVNFYHMEMVPGSL